MLGGLIGAIIGLIIVGIIQMSRNSAAKKHAADMQRALAKGGSEGRAALDRRLPPRARLESDQAVEGQTERVAALSALGDADTIASELEAWTGSALHLATARSVGYVALALHGRDPAAHAARLEADLAAVAGANKLSLRAISAWLPVLRALAGQHALTEAERAEALRFQTSAVVKELARTAFAKAEAIAATPS